ncbi:MAG: holo-ACP synthase [Candidatus Coatesbacteria bacterium]|nr:holo-ACP synthase [Candidatus Coatesbacteria bacterium]
MVKQFDYEELNGASSRGDLERVGAIGVDIVQVSRVKEIAERRGERFLRRYFSKGEVYYSLNKCDPYPHLAVRFAAKEAAHKAFSSAGMGSLPLSSFEIAVEPSGVPRLLITDGASSQLAAGSVSVSLSHGGDYAVAVVALLGDVKQPKNDILRQVE